MSAIDASRIYSTTSSGTPRAIFADYTASRNSSLESFKSYANENAV